MIENGEDGDQERCLIDTEHYAPILKRIHNAAIVEYSKNVHITTVSVVKMLTAKEMMHLIEIGQPASPPKIDFIDWILTPHDAVDARANLDEVMDTWVERYGYNRAVRIYKWQAIRIAARYLLDRLLSRAERVLKLVRLGF